MADALVRNCQIRLGEVGAYTYDTTYDFTEELNTIDALELYDQAVRARPPRRPAAARTTERRK